jgi:hypothetical protein
MMKNGSQFLPESDRRKAVSMPTLTPLFRPGVPAQTKVKRLPASLWEIEGKLHTGHLFFRTGVRRAAKDKQATIALGQALVSENCLQQDGGLIKVKKDISHSDLAPSIGLKCRESACRLQRKVDRRVISAERTKVGFRYSWEIPQKSNRTYQPRHFQHASAADASKECPGLFAEDSSRVNFLHVPEIVNHPDVPLRTTDRLVLGLLFALKLFVRKSGDIWASGRVMKTQEQLGAMLGMHRDTVRASLRRLSVEWTDRQGNKHKGLGLLKIIGKPGQWMLNGIPVEHKVPGAVWQQQEPNEYVGVANFVETDKQRYDKAMESIRACHQSWAEMMDQIYGDTRLEWLESGGQLKTFHAECRRRMMEVKILQRLIDQAIPPPLPA